MRLFSTQGFAATSVSQIEAAAGLAAGSGALYHHFKSKEALLEAGIARQLDRRHAMADIRAIFAGLGDLHAELTAMSRYLHNILEQETELLQIAARTPTGRSASLDTAYAALIDGLTAELTDWITTWAPAQNQQQCASLATVGLNAILGAHLATSLFHQDPPQQTNHYLTEWTKLLATRIEALNADKDLNTINNQPA
ncbi:putative transcriptional regulator, TetR family protein [Mycolicibacterium cyprinidarum]|nr:putative transcriptional regulator, TetR family protein [Mycolicibacterium sp. NGTWS1803]